MHSAFVQVAAEECEQVWGQEERLHQWTLGQLPSHLEDAVCPKNRQKNINTLKKIGTLKICLPGLKIPDAGLQWNTRGQELLSLWQESIQQGQSKLEGYRKKNETIFIQKDPSAYITIREQTLFWHASIRDSLDVRERSLRKLINWLNDSPPITFRSGG